MATLPSGGVVRIIVEDVATVIEVKGGTVATPLKLQISGTQLIATGDHNSMRRISSLAETPRRRVTVDRNG